MEISEDIWEELNNPIHHNKLREILDRPTALYISCSPEPVFAASHIAEHCTKRMGYIRNKLSCCEGYNKQEKNIRYEELHLILNTFCNGGKTGLT